MGCTLACIAGANLGNGYCGKEILTIGTGSEDAIGAERHGERVPRAVVGSRKNDDSSRSVLPGFANQLERSHSRGIDVEDDDVGPGATDGDLGGRAIGYDVGEPGAL